MTARVIPFPLAHGPDEEPGNAAPASTESRTPPAPAGREPADPVIDGSDGEPQPLLGARIVVVEHDQVTRETLTLTLEDWGAIVMPFGSVADAVATLEDSAPDAAIVAIRMPGDPYRFIAAMRRRDGRRRRHTPMLAIVGGALDRRRATSAGIHLHLARPFDPARLRLALANLVHAAA